MKSIFKPALLAITLGSFALSAPTVSFADHHADKATKAENPAAAMKHSPEFMKQLAHASFLPNIMKHLKKNQKSLEISDEQMKALNNYHQHNAPKTHNMVKAVMELEKKAHQMALDNYPPEMVMDVGSSSIQARHDLMMAKLRCRDFVKATLKPEQYKKALTSYK